MAAMWSSSVYRCSKNRLFNHLIGDINELKCYNLKRIKNVALYSSRSYQTTVKPKNRYFLLGMLGLGTGVVVGSTYSYYRLLEMRPIPNDDKETTCHILQSLPDVPIARRVVSPTDTTGLNILLFQYPTCPFCCKVRAFLDYYGLSYDVVEVNPVLRQQIKWSNYRKVPILLVKVDGGYQQLNDSSMIISVLGSYLHDKYTAVSELVKFYPTIEYHDENHRRKKDIMNKYFLMYQGEAAMVNNDLIQDERKWRKWADDVLVHSLSPNVYRTKAEALEAFRWFSKVGEWERLFSAWEVNLMVYLGATAMWIIGKQLKKRHSLKDDVRQSLYDDCNRWLKQVRQKGTRFHGGKTPDLADLAVYGVLSSIEGCEAFNDVLSNTRIGDWYNSVKNLCTKNRGDVILESI